MKNYPFLFYKTSGYLGKIFEAQGSCEVLCKKNDGHYYPLIYSEYRKKFYFAKKFIIEISKKDHFRLNVDIKSEMIETDLSCNISLMEVYLLWKNTNEKNKQVQA